MMANLNSSLTLTAAIGSGVMAGVFFTFSVFVMQALEQIPVAHAVSVMQSINTTIVRSLFIVVFFGTAACSLALLVTAYSHWGTSHAIYLGIGSILYLVGVMLVTMIFNVPLNNALADLDIANNLSDSAWLDYSTPWNVWNHVRTIAAVAASAAFTLGLVEMRG